MQQKRIRSAIALAALFVAAGGATAQVVRQPQAPAPNAAASAQAMTLGDVALLAKEAEIEKRQKELRDLKQAPVQPVAASADAAGLAAQDAPKPVHHVRKKVKPLPPPPDRPEGLQVRAIFGVAPNTYARFYTKTGEFEDHLVGDIVQGWKLIDIHNGVTTLQRGKAQALIAVQMRPASTLEVGGNQGQPAATATAARVMQAGALPDPNLGVIR